MLGFGFIYGLSEPVSGLVHWFIVSCETRSIPILAVAVNPPTFSSTKSLLFQFHVRWSNGIAAEAIGLGVFFCFCY